MVVVAAVLHLPVAWFIQRLYRRTAFSEALDEYQKQIECKPHPGPDATHPRNQGLLAVALHGLWKHFESFSVSSAVLSLDCFLFLHPCWDMTVFALNYVRDLMASFLNINLHENAAQIPHRGFILERDMHFVVANIVKPLTESKEVSFVTLWGGRQVDYFVPLGDVV